MAISKKAWTGIALETTPGTAVATPTKYIPTQMTFKAGKKKERMNEERGDRNANYGSVSLNRQSSLDFKGSWYNDTHPYLLLGAFGAVASSQPDASGSPTVWKHLFSLADVPPTFTVMTSLDAATYSIAFSAVEKFSIKFSSEGKLLECEASLMGLYPSKVVTPPTPTWSTVLPFAGYAPQISLTGGATSDINEFQLDFEQKVSLWYPANGTPDFTKIDFGERSATLSYTARFDNDTVYQRFLNDTLDTITVLVQGPTISGALKQELQFSIPVIDYDDMEHDKGKDNVLIKAKATALAQSTQFISAYVQNTVTGYAS